MTEPLGSGRPTNRALAQADMAAIMGRLSPDALRTLRAVAAMRHRPPEEVLREELEGYVADQIPAVDVEGLIRLMGARLYEIGYLVGSMKRFIRKHRS